MALVSMLLGFPKVPWVLKAPGIDVSANVLVRVEMSLCVCVHLCVRAHAPKL